MVAPAFQKSEQRNSFSNSYEQYCELTNRLCSNEALQMRHSDLEKLIAQEGRELMRRLLEEHLRLRGTGDVGQAVTGVDDLRRGYKTVREKSLNSIFGQIDHERMAYGAPGVEGLVPKDANLNIPQDSYSHGLRRLIAEEAAKASFDETTEAIERITGVHVPKRQAEELTARAALDFAEFYEQGLTAEAIQTATETLPLLVLSIDGKGIVMRKEDLREETRTRAEQMSHKLNRRISRGEKRNAKRIASVASVYNIDEFIRTPEQVAGEFAPTRLAGVPQRPRPAAKRVWASIENDRMDIINEAFAEGLRRDPQKTKHWVCLVDGERQQLRWLRLAAKRRKINITIVLDIIHVLEYLWKAARAFYEDVSPEGEKWVTQRLLEILRGRASLVAAGMRRSATRKGLLETQRKTIDVCAGSLPSGLIPPLA